MPVIRIPSRVIAECEEYLRMNGLFKDGMKMSRMVESLISHVIYGTVDLEEGRKRAAELLAKTEGTDKPYVLRGKLAKFTAVADWSGSSKESSIPKKLRDELNISERELSKDILTEGDLFREEDHASDSVEKVRLPTPPWLELPKADLDAMARRYPKHLIWKWIGDDQLRELAVSTAFAIVPRSLHKAGKIEELSLRLHDSFLEWEKGGDTNNTQAKNVIKY